MLNNINQFPFYKNYYELLDNLPNEDKKIMLEIIVDFMFKDIEPKKLNGMNLAIWNNIKLPLSSIKKQIINGQKGGRPKKENNKNKKPNDNPNNNPIKNPNNNPIKNQNNIFNFIFLFNNININNIINKDTIYNLLKEYIEIRYKNKYVVNETVVKRLVKKLNEYGTTDEEKIEIIENAINGKWKDFYKLNNYKEQKPEWFDKNIEKQKATEEEIKEMEEILKNYK